MTWHSPRSFTRWVCRMGGKGSMPYLAIHRGTACYLQTRSSLHHSSLAFWMPQRSANEMSFGSDCSQILTLGIGTIPTSLSFVIASECWTLNSNTRSLRSPVSGLLASKMRFEHSWSEIHSCLQREDGPELSYHQLSMRTKGPPASGESTSKE